MGVSMGHAAGRAYRDRQRPLSGSPSGASLQVEGAWADRDREIASGRYGGDGPAALDACLDRCRPGSAGRDGTAVLRRDVDDGRRVAGAPRRGKSEGASGGVETEG